MPDNATYLYKLKVRCQRCEGEQTFLFPSTMSADEIFLRLFLLVNNHCPYCNDPERWTIYGVSRFRTNRKEIAKNGN